jgi:formylglycine-generating enzyme required for sulfatase activity
MLRSAVNTRARVLLALVLKSLAACAGDGGDPASGTGPGGAGPAATALVLQAGGGQSGEVEVALPNAVVVRATNVLGAPVAGATVTAVSASDGGTVTPASQVTGSDGTAAFTWTLGPVEGRQSVRLRAGGAPEVVVEAIGTMARTLELVTPTLSGEAGGPTIQPLVVRVRRARDQAAQAGQRVRASAGSGGVLNPAEATTGTDGTASFTWTLGPVVGSQEATVALVAAPEVSRSAIATATPEARTLQVVGGNNQTAEFGQLLPDSVRVRLVRTRDQAPIANATVTFSVASGGGTVSAASRVTDADGRAAVRWALGSTAATQEVAVTVEATSMSSSASQAISATAIAPLGVGYGDAQFALIPAGSFQMGTVGGGPRGGEAPVRQVTLSAFLMQRTEVTQGQWRQVMAGTALANPSRFSSCGDRCPVERVSWNDIQQFLLRLNQQDPGKGYRLPTEAEWEYAARAGTTGDYGIAGAVCSFAWIWDGDCSQGRTWPVAQKPANAWGLHDMHGNVWEWVEDCYGAYPSTPETNPRRTTCSASSERVLRGGAWEWMESRARSAERGTLPPSAGNDGVGFRLARTP